MSELTKDDFIEPAVGGTKIQWPDIVVIILYFVSILGVGLWVSKYYYFL